MTAPPSSPAVGSAAPMVDIGANLSSSQFTADLDEVIERAHCAGVRWLVATGTSLEGSREAVRLACEHPGIRATAGLHPHRASAWSDKGTRDGLHALLEQPAVVAVGECGLDYFRMLSPRAEQLRAFEEQLQWAVETGKPTFLHCRQAFDDFCAVLRNHPQARGVVHCFTDGAQEAETLLSLGYDIGVTGWVADPRRGQSLREALPRVPLQRLHLETDAPYLLPCNMPGAQRRGRNEPAHLVWVARAVADLLGLPLEQVAQVCTGNSVRLFGLAPQH